MPTINVNDAYVLNETGAEVDKVTGLFTKNENATTGEKQMARLNIAAGGSNPNLLDNAYFVGGGSQLGDGIFPINQRGQTTYSNSSYGIDRWVGNYTLNAGYLTVNGFMYQIASYPLGVPLTFSAMLADGSVVGGTLTITETTTQEYFYTDGSTIKLVKTSNNGALMVWTGSSVNIKAVKLEKGTVSTLANDPPPDFGEELRKCQRYLWVATCEANDIMASGVTFGTNVIFDLITPVQIRGTQANVAIGVTPYIAVDNTVVLCGGSSAQGNIKGNHIRFQIGATADLGTYKNCNLLIPSVTFLQVANEL